MKHHEIHVFTDGKLSDLTVGIKNRAKGRDFNFALKTNFLRVTPSSKAKNGDDALDWLASLNDREKVDVMKTILARYREPSLQRDKWKVSSIGITKNPNDNNPDVDAMSPADKHLAFIGVNTEMRSDELDKDCAEQNMLSGMVNNISQHQWNNRGTRLTKPPAPEEIHVMGGRDPDPNNPLDKGERIIAPCGKCTDTLAALMKPEGYVFIYPANNGNMPLTINEKADTINDVGSNKVWKTTIGHLNRYRHIALTPDQGALQQQGLDTLAEDLLKPAPDVADEVIERAATNARKHQSSIPELDVATAGGVVSPAAMNLYMRNSIIKILRSRMKSEGIPEDKNTVLGWLKSNRIGSISIGVVQHADGTYAAGAKAKSSLSMDRASASSQLSGINSLDSIITRGEHPVIQSWSMSFSIEDIVSGQTTTPSKDGIERLIKVMDSDAVKTPFTHFVFNSGNLSAAELEQASRSFSVKDLSPGGFKGGNWRSRTQTTEHGCGHDH